MKRIFVIFALLLGCISASNAQLSTRIRPKGINLGGQFVTGGNMGVGLSGNYFHISLAPQVGYRIIHELEIGVRGTYSFEVDWSRAYGTRTYHYFGGAPYVSLEVFQGIFLHGEYEKLYCFSRKTETYTPVNRWYDSMFVGGGYRTYSNGGDNYAFFMILYNLFWDRQVMSNEGTPYRGPISIRVGYCF